ncbi:hypothetical protein CL629_04255 [bacterium]|nr:hypothetical protein [bacterium]|tara:strand:- start:11572 stop:12810 length:1239 start_codon:yes stop_codon:yes gene_type:complete
MKRIYLDYSASSPVDKQVLKEMTPYFTEKFGNAGSLHSFGQEAVRALDVSREACAKTIGADFREVVFTSSATEANNLALRGTVQGVKDPQIIVSSIEHESVLETARDLEGNGVEVVYLPVDKNGLVDLKKLKTSINERTVLVSIMYGNNVMGAIQPIREIANIVREFRKANKLMKLPPKADQPKAEKAKSSQVGYPLLHTDAVQSFQYLDCDVERLGIDLMSLSSHKIYGPKGVGLLYVRGNREANEAKSYKLKAIITGGKQEFGFRSGTPNVAGIVGFTKALEITKETRKEENRKTKELKEYLWKKLKEKVLDVEINPDTAAKGKDSFLPSIINIHFPKRESQEIITLLDARGVAVSSGAACSVRSAGPSYVITALGLSKERLNGNIRISLGRHTTKEEIDEAVRRITMVI